MTGNAVLDALERAKQYSPFLAKQIVRHESITDILKTGDMDAACNAALAICCDTMDEQLRKQRSALALAIAIADLSGHWSLSQVTQRLSNFADHALDCAIEQAFAEYLPDQPVMGFAVIALGKHGGRELNYSSDIDPIFLFDPETLPADGDVAKIAVRIGKRVIALLNERTEHDYVFRVDMRLRPASEITPVAISVNAAISHYESSALAWEQAAFIRARAAAGDKILGQYFLDAIDSFIWRRNLDFGQIDNIRKMSHNIRDHFSKGQKLGIGYDLKRGRGGIRECEFYTQVHQLIHGGRNASLREADTCMALKSLYANNHISLNQADIIAEGYSLLRSVEHRLQMINDRQTHVLSADDIDNAAKLHGLKDSSALLDLLEKPVSQIEALYDNLVVDDESISLAEAGLPLRDQLDAMGLKHTDKAMTLIQKWRSGKYRAVRSAPAIASFEATMPALLGNIAGSPDPDRALSRLDNMLEKLPSAINLFNLLGKRPDMLKLLGNILSYAPTLADALGRDAALLDGMSDNQSFADKTALMSQMQSYFQDDWDYETLLGAVSNFVAETRFAIGARLIEGAAPLDAAKAYADLADAAIEKLARATTLEFAKVHGSVEGGELMIMALGRFGGHALTHASDLDIIFLFTGDFSSQSNGERPLGATQYFNRLAQRIIAALTLPTATGALYEVDTRLRPSGSQGLLAVSMSSFEKYQRESAWTWEHMALTRARLVYGSTFIEGSIKDHITPILAHFADDARYADIASMRSDMRKAKPADTALDIKNANGGLIDIEFIVHALQLHHDVDIDPDINRSITILVEAQLLMDSLLPAYMMMSKMLILLRLLCPDLSNITPAAQTLLAANLEYDDWDKLMTDLALHQSNVQEQWNKTFNNHA